MEICESCLQLEILKCFSICLFIFQQILQVLTKYVEEGFPFLLRVFNIPKYLEDLTGLTKLMEDTKILDVRRIFVGKTNRFTAFLSFTDIVSSLVLLYL